MVISVIFCFTIFMCICMVIFEYFHGDIHVSTFMVTCVYFQGDRFIFMVICVYFHGDIRVCIFRVIWLLLFLGGMVIFLIQVATSIQYYLSWPVSVDVKINYNDSVLFPAVTICNSNAFR